MHDGLSDLTPPVAIISLQSDSRTQAVIQKLDFKNCNGRRPTCYILENEHVAQNAVRGLSPEEGNVLLIFDAGVGEVPNCFSCCGTRKGPNLPEWARGKVRWGVGIGRRPMSDARILSVAQDINARFFKNFEHTVGQGILPYGERPARKPSPNYQRRRRSKRHFYDPLEIGYAVMGGSERT